MRALRRRQQGFSLVEVLVSLAIFLIASMGLVPLLLTEMLRRWQTWRGAQQVLEDFKAAQARAERRGGTVLGGGALVTARSFLVFEPDQRRYALFDWEDADGDGTPAAGETRRVWTRELPPAVRFGWAAGIDRKACSNQVGAPASAITFGTAGYPPCEGRPCLKFDQQGYSSMGPGAVYLVDDTQSFALTGTRPGHFTVCRWDGVQWR